MAQRLDAVRTAIANACERAGRTDGVTLVAVCKTVPPRDVLEAFAAGQRVFGENRVQEAVAKQDKLAESMPEAVWHLIGHLQRNKVKTAVDRFSLVQSVDSLRLAQDIDRRAAAAGTVMPVLLEVNVAGESTKSGFIERELMEALPTLRTLHSLELRGLMTVAPLVSDASDVTPIFRLLRLLRDAITQEYELTTLRELSMGMSNDFREAIQEGATIVRIGRAIFGDRKV